jgi:hypothetical protein
MAASLGACTTPIRTAKVAVAAPAPAPPAPGRTAAASAQTATSQKSDDPNQIICVREEVTGSRLPPAKECHTRAQWAQRRANGDQQLQLIGAAPNAGAMQGNGR